MAGKTRPSLRRKVLYNVEHSNLNATDKECIKAVFEKFDDAVEVVRCKDCKYAVLTTGEDFVVGCENCGYDILERDKNDFCSQGKRRDDN